MALTDTEKRGLTEMYENLAEEFHIMHREFRLAGFSSDDAIKLMIAVTSQPVKIDNYREAMKIRRNKQDIMRDFVKKQREREQIKENENG